MGGFRAAGLAAAAATALGVVSLAAPSYADTTVTVQGTAFPDPARANLSFVGCDDLYQRTDERLAPTVGSGPGVAPAGTRSLGWDLSGGNAVGAVFPVPSMLATTTASLDVNSSDHATGVAYAGYQQPSDAGTSLLWIGRAALTTPGGAWQRVDATDRVYTWTRFDMDTRTQLDSDDGVPSTVAAFAAAHGGDGPGFYTIGFGCDGTPFSMDALSVGSAGSVTTYDLEALRTSVSIGSEETSGQARVTIIGQLSDETDTPIPFATMILERRQPGSRVWKPVQVAEATEGVVRVTVERDDQRAFYRWRFVERPLAEGSASPALVLDGLSLPPLPPLPTASPSPSGTPPTGTPITDPTSAPPTGQPTPEQTPTSSPSASDPDPTTAPPTSTSPTTSATTSPTGSPSSGSPSASPGDPTGDPASPSDSRTHETS